MKTNNAKTMKNAFWGQLMPVIEGFEIDRASHYTCRAPLFGRLHEHASRFHLSYVVNGTGEIGIEAFRGSVSAGDMVVIRPGSVHTSYGDAKMNYELIEICFSSENVAAIAAVPLNDGIIHVHNTGAMMSAMERLIIAHLLSRQDGGWLTRVRLIEILMLLHREANLNEAPGTGGTDIERKINQAVEYAALHYAEPLTVEMLAEAVGMSGSHFAACFKQKMKVTPIEFVIQQRIHHAAELLANSAIPISTIAQMCGFSSAGYFARIFQQRCGMSARTYRNQQTKHRHKDMR